MATQCPNCGGYKTNQSWYWYDPVTSSRTKRHVEPVLRLSPRERAWARGRWVGLIVIAALVAANYFNYHFGSRQLFTTTGFGGNVVAIIVVACLIISLVGYGVVRHAWQRAEKEAATEAKTRDARSVRVDTFYCELCGYNWEERLGKPLRPHPGGQRPDLLRLASERMEEEERARKAEEEERARNAAADAWQRHLRGEI